MGRRYKPTSSRFSGKIYCGECGGLYGSKVWHSTSKYRRTIWQCNDKFKNDKKCETPHLSEELLKEAFITVFNELVGKIDEVSAFIAETITQLSDTGAVDKKIAVQTMRCEQAGNEVQEYIYLNSRTPIPPEEYNAHFAELMSAYEAEEHKKSELEQERMRLLSRAREIEIYMKMLSGKEPISEFDEGLFSSVMERITVFKERIVFEFKDGTEIGYTY